MFSIIIDEISVGSKYKNKLSYPTKNETMKEGFITDENKSVKWNREQVEINKAKYINDLNEYHKTENNIYKLIQEDVINIIVKQLHCTKKAAEFLFTSAYNREHSDGWSAILYELESMVDTICDYNKFNQEEI